MFRLVAVGARLYDALFSFTFRILLREQHQMDQSRLTSLSLVEGLVNKDDHSWKRLDSLYGPFVDYWIRKSGVADGDEQDLRQEVLLSVSTSINNYKHSESESGSLRRWIWGIACNKINDYRRRRRKSVIASGGTAALKKVNALPDEPFEDSDPDTLTRMRKELLARALGILKQDFEDKTWQSFFATVVNQRPTKEVAESMNMTTKAVRQARYRVLKRLREELGNDLPQ